MMNFNFDQIKEPFIKAKEAITDFINDFSFSSKSVGNETKSKAVAKEKKNSPASKLKIGNQTRYLAQSIIIEEADQSNITIWSMVIISSFILVLILWSAITEINESAVTYGQVMPSETKHTIQHFEGGIISKVNVKDGDLVKKGQKLVELASEATLSELEQTRSRQAALKLQIQRLRSFVFSDGKADFIIEDKYHTLLKNQKSILKFQIESKKTQEEILKKKILQRSAELEVLREQEKTLNEQLNFVEEELKMQSELLAKGLLSKIVFLQTRREISSLKGTLSELQGSISGALAAISESEAALLELDARLKDEALREMGQASSELAQIDQSIKRLEDKNNRLNVVATSDGIVKGLSVSTTGSVISPGQELLDIIPLSQRMIVESKIAPKDIGYVSVGQQVDVKFTSYDFSRFGTLTGTLKHISATTFTDEDGNYYYKGIIDLPKNYLGENSKKNIILPGMIVQADIIIGSKSLLRYILKPIYASLNSAFREK